ncbi:MAG: C10 family peptidase [Bacteroidaceae bacterium]|nr:C10 family peptidase [Bacteroidaceae bacterium]
MRKCLSMVFLFCSLTVSADTITEEQAHEIACSFFSTPSSSHKPKARSAAPQMSLAFKMGSADSPLYVFNRDSNGGYVVIAGDDALDKPVVGWADEGNLDEKHLAPALRGLLQEYQRQLEFLRSHPASARKAAGDGNDAQVVVAPLIKTYWNQTAPFNQMLPPDFHVTGCTPTAMAQIMKYWKWPCRGRGSHTNRTHPDNWEQLLSEGRFDELKAGHVIATVDFSQSEYDWDNMLYDYRAGAYTDKQAEAVAKLMLDCNTAADSHKTDWSGFSVGASPKDAAKALARYFSYRNDWKVILGNQDSLIMRELDDNRPVMYYNYNHCFVCDGYNDAGYFHFNFGWSGIADGYYLTSLINPLEQDFSNASFAIIGIQPSMTSFEKDGICYDVIDGTRAGVIYAQTSDANIEGKVTNEGKEYTVTKIFSRAFDNLDVDFNVVRLPATLDTICPEAFYRASVKTIDLGSLEMWNNIHFADRYANPQSCGMNSYLLNGQPIIDLYVPAALGKVRSHLLQYNTTLQRLTFENGISEISDSAFFGCTNLEYVDLPHTAVKIGNAAFRNGVNNSRLETVSALNMATSIGDRAFEGCPISNIWLNDSLTYVGNSAFSHHKTEYIDIPAKLERIGRQAFYSDNLYGFRDKEKKNTSYSIHNDALYNAEGTRLLQVPAMVRNSNGYGKRYEFGVLKTTRTISSEAFMGCRGIRKVIIPASVVDIEKGAFLYLDELTDFSNYATTPQTIEEGTFADSPFEYKNVERRAKLHIQEGCGEAYASAPYWNRFNIIEDIPAGSHPEPGYDGEINVNGFILTYRLSEGGWEEMRCLFADNPELTTDSKGLVVTTDKLRISIGWNSEECLLDELIFTELDDPNGIEEIRNSDKPSFLFSGNTIRIFGQGKDTTAWLYTLDGRQVLSSKVTARGEALMVLPDSGPRAYLLRVDNQSVLIQKR